jgi:hypothetical protein
MFPYYDLILEAAQKEQVPLEVAKLLFGIESSFNPNAISPKNAQGLGQLMPETQKALGVTDPFNPAQNIPASMKYLKQGYDRWGTWPQAAGYYHSGPGNMEKVAGDITKLGPRGREYTAKFTKFGSSPVTNTPAVTTTGDVKMEPYDDEYTKMALFNPYVQMALGIMSGNSGINKTEAFSNAMKGGLGAVQTGQEMQRRQGEEKRNAMMTQMKMREYERMRNSSKQIQSWAAAELERNPNSPMASTLRGIAGAEDPEVALKFGELMNRDQYNQLMLYHYMNPTTSGRAPTSLELWMRDPEKFQEFKEAEAAAQNSAVGTPVPIPASDKLYYDKLLKSDPRLKDQRGIFWDTGTYNQMQEFLPQEAHDIHRKSRGKITKREAYDQAMQNYLDAAKPEETNTIQAPVQDVVTDSSGRKWRYKGSGDKTKQENYELVQ